MAGIENLNTLLASMEPVLNPQEFVFCTVTAAEASRYFSQNPIGIFREAEGVTLIMGKSQADRSELRYEGVFSMISLTVHSSLSAVGLTAAVATALSAQSISANVVAAYFHDHVFVPVVRAQDAMKALRQLSASAAQSAE